MKRKSSTLASLLVKAVQLLSPNSRLLNPCKSIIINNKTQKFNFSALFFCYFRHAAEWSYKLEVNNNKIHNFFRLIFLYFI